MENFDRPRRASSRSKQRKKDKKRNMLPTRSQDDNCKQSKLNRTYSNEYKIKKVVFDGYDITTRPVMNDSVAMTVVIGMSLYHILDTLKRKGSLLLGERGGRDLLSNIPLHRKSDFGFPYGTLSLCNLSLTFSPSSLPVEGAVVIK
ncbi:DgyrCDS10724 [Dimorphilus gyrociliatus]|uniref:DgyrCDS10724 n=1 Tax=Dimorphilus gyrociliatus TaxID=2664684 RepID=A0A7I8W131_9ANNE|nr:DgyrCDS10724 [Dimorphilus gyrociliatus]